MIIVFIKSSEALSVHNYDRSLSILISLSVEDFFPDPKTFGTRIDSWPYLESSLLSIFSQLLHEKLIQNVRLASSVFAADSNDSNFALDL